MLQINQLPFDVLTVIQKYTSINNLLDSCKSFKDSRKILYNWKLTRLKSQYYVSDPNFRNKANQIINHNNLSLDLNGIYTIIKFTFPTMYKVDMECNIKITDVSVFKNVHKLDLAHCCQISDVSALGNVYNLNLSFCSKITDFSALKNIHTLSLKFCNISDVSALGNVHILNLYQCERVSNTEKY
jgi:hypothetical protein